MNAEYILISRKLTVLPTLNKISVFCTVTIRLFPIFVVDLLK